MQAQQASVEFRLITAQNNCLNAQANLKYIMNYNAEERVKIDARSVSEVHPGTPRVVTPKRFSRKHSKHCRKSNWPLTKSVPHSSACTRQEPGYIPRSVLAEVSLSEIIVTSVRGISSRKSRTANQIGKGFSIGMSIPFYSGLSRRSSLQRAKHNYQSSKIKYQQTERALYNEIQQALQDLKSCTQRYRIAVQRENFSTLSYNAARKRYEQGLITIIDLNTTSNSLLEAKYDVLRARLDYVMQKRMIDFIMKTVTIEN